MNFDRILLWSDFKVQRMQKYSKSDSQNNDLPHKKTVDKLLSEANNIHIPSLEHLPEYQEVKTALINFHKSQIKMIENNDLLITNYLIHDILYQSLRQLLMEIQQLWDERQQYDYFERVYDWFKRRKEVLSEESRLREIDEPLPEGPPRIHKTRQGKRTIHLNVKAPEKRLTKFKRK